MGCTDDNLGESYKAWRDSLDEPPDDAGEDPMPAWDAVKPPDHDHVPATAKENT